MTRHLYFTGICRMHLEHTEGSPTSVLKETNVRLELSKNLDKDRYLQRDLPTKEGLHVLQNTLIHGIMTNIKIAHEKGWKNESEGLKYVIDELHRAFVGVHYSDPKIEEGTM